MAAQRTGHIQITTTNSMSNRQASGDLEGHMGSTALFGKKNKGVSQRPVGFEFSQVNIIKALRNAAFSFLSFVFAFSCLPLLSLPFRSACKWELGVTWNHYTAIQKVSFLPIRIVRQQQEWDKWLFELVATHRASIRLRSGERAATDEGENRLALCQMPA